MDFNLIVNYKRNNEMTSKAGRYIIYTNHNDTIIYKKTNNGKYGNLLIEDLKDTTKFNKYKNTLQNSHKLQFLGEHIIKVYDIEADGSYKSKLIKGFELGPFIENKNIPENIQSKMLVQINVLRKNITDYWNLNEIMIGDWNDKNCVYSIEDDKIYNVDIEGFYNYKYEKNGKCKSTESSITWITSLLDNVTNNINKLQNK